LPHAGPHALVAGHSCARRAHAATTETPLHLAVPLAGFGPTLQRSLVRSFASPSLAASLQGVRVPVLLAVSHARTRHVPPKAQSQPARARGAH